MAVPSDFINIAYEALNTFNREVTGFIPSVTRNAALSRASLDETIRIPLSAVGESQDIVPGMNLPTADPVSDDFVDVKMEKSKRITFPLGNPDTGKAQQNTGTYSELMRARFEDAYSKLASEMEGYIYGKALIGASRAYGTAGTTPFAGADMMDFAKLNQMLTDNGCPNGDRQLVLNSSAVANLAGKNANIFRVNEFGSDDYIRNGMTNKPMYGFKLWESGGITTHEKGTGNGYLINGAAAAKTSQLNIDTGSGTVKAGDVVTFAGDDNKYIVGHGADAAGSIVINKPGLMMAAADNVAMTIGGSYLPSIAFHKRAIILGVRKPFSNEGDSALDTFDVFDARSGLLFEVKIYGGYRTGQVEVGITYGAKVIKTENVVALLG